MMTIFDQNIETRIYIKGDRWLPKEMTVSRSRYNETDSVKMRAVPDPDDNPEAVPDEGDEMYVELGPQSSVADIGRDTVTEGQLVRVFTGYVTNIFDFANGAWEIEATNYFLDLKTTEITISIDEPVLLSKLVERVLERVMMFTGIDLRYNISLEGTTAIPYGFSRWQASGPVTKTDVLTTKEFTNVNAAQILDTLSEMGNAIWWIDGYNRLQFGPTDTVLHKLDWVTDTSAGKQTPPYRSVKVVGDNVVSEEGWEYRKFISQQPGVLRGKVSNIPEGPAEPTFVYKNRSIKTQQEAAQVRNRLLDELQRQQASGHVTVVGRPMIDILDVIEMPDRFARTSDSPIGESETIEAAQYSVEKVEHRLNPSDGYITRVECGGLAGRYSGPVLEYASGNTAEQGQMILSTEESTEPTEGEAN